jgi:hypothetical protein
MRLPCLGRFLTWSQLNKNDSTKFNLKLSYLVWLKSVTLVWPRVMYMRRDGYESKAILKEWAITVFSLRTKGHAKNSREHGWESYLRRAQKGCVKASSTPEISKIQPHRDKILSQVLRSGKTQLIEKSHQTRRPFECFLFRAVCSFCHPLQENSSLVMDAWTSAVKMNY